jgi:hypothetical protein
MGVEAVVLVMESFLESAQMEKQASCTVLTLAGDDAISIEMLDKGIASCLANALVAHPLDAGVQQFACLAFSNITLAGDMIRKRLHNAGLIEVCSYLTQIVHTELFMLIYIW